MYSRMNEADINYSSKFTFYRTYIYVYILDHSMNKQEFLYVFSISNNFATVDELMDTFVLEKYCNFDLH